MLAENTGVPPKKSTFKKWLPWLNLLLALVLIGLGLWYLAQKIELREIGEALAFADPVYIALGVLISVVTIGVKAWRWQYLLYKPGATPDFMASFWATSLGQYVNYIVPFFRLGEVARIYALNQQTNIKMSRSLGTLIVEKTLDLIFFGLTIALVLPFVILPKYLDNSGIFIGMTAFAFLIILYLMAYQTERLSIILGHLKAKAPLNILRRFIQIAITGLGGLSSLRSRRLTLIIVGQTILIAVLSVLLPYVLFPAFGLQLGIEEATLIHIVASIAVVPPSTPGKIGVLNGAVVFTLYSLDVNADAAIIGYAIIFHLVVVLPQIVLGIIAAWRTNWRLEKTTAIQQNQ